MKHEKTFEAISKLKDIEIELHRLKNALEMANKVIDAAVAAEREACAQIVRASADACGDDAIMREILKSNAAAIRARGNKT